MLTGLCKTIKPNLVTPSCVRPWHATRSGRHASAVITIPHVSMADARYSSGLHVRCNLICSPIHIQMKFRKDQKFSAIRHPARLLFVPQLHATTVYLHLIFIKLNNRLFKWSLHFKSGSNVIPWYTNAFPGRAVDVIHTELSHRLCDLLTFKIIPAENYLR